VTDAYRAAHPRRVDAEGTYHGFRGEVSGARIDWILHSTHFETVSSTIDRTEEGGRWPSDHFPVSAVLRWK
jgi:endonuclease/exonuclease/phosphatase family metal-dependent hydrolase